MAVHTGGGLLGCTTTSSSCGTGVEGTEMSQVPFSAEGGDGTLAALQWLLQV